jgi:hypothetical protein
LHIATEFKKKVQTPFKEKSGKEPLPQPHLSAIHFVEYDSNPEQKE